MAVFYGNFDVKFIVFVGFDYVDEVGYMMVGCFEVLIGEDLFIVD